MEISSQENIPLDDSVFIGWAFFSEFFRFATKATDPSTIEPNESVFKWGLLNKSPLMFGPNINGYFRIDYATFIHSTGAFSVNKTNEEVLAQGAQLLNVNRGMNFFAYQSSSVYSGSKLQPESLQVLACIRFWYRLGSVKPDFVL